MQPFDRGNPINPATKDLALDLASKRGFRLRSTHFTVSAERSRSTVAEHSRSTASC